MVTKAQRESLAPLLAFARRDGRLAREAGKPRTSNPHRYNGERLPVTTASELLMYRLQRLRAAWLAGWQGND